MPTPRRGLCQCPWPSGLGGHIRIESADFTEDGGYRATVHLLSSAEPPTAIFAVDDLTCVGARSAASEMNVDVPGSTGPPPR